MNILDKSYFIDPDPKPNDNHFVELTDTNVLDILKEAQIDLTRDIPEPPVCLEIIGANGHTVMSTLGNLSLVMGKAKSRKTFFITMAPGAATRNGVLLDKFNACLPEDRKTVVFFDTEQLRYHVHRTAKRVCSLNGAEAPENFKVYSLRKYKHQEKLMLIEQAIYSSKELSFVVNDGVRDLVKTINNEEDATDVVCRLLRWTEELNIHIMVVLHQNKGNDFARGHLGTELVNKGETELVVAVDHGNKQISIVDAEYCRDAAPEPFSFGVNDDSLPFIDPLQQSTASKSNAPTSISLKEHKQVLFEAFRFNPKHSELVEQLNTAFRKQGKNLGDSKAKEFLRWRQNEKHIIAYGAERSPNRYYEFTWVGPDG